MKRRTNLFYSSKNVDESNFLTFSNYAEHLTGVSLATNFKIFPSRFLCLYIPALNTNKPEVNNTEAPEVNNTEAPEVNNTEAPEVNNTEAPEVNNTEAPEVNNTEAPEDNNTEAPEVNNTEAPEDSNIKTELSAREKFIINHLVGYYENKLAMMRDKCSDDGSHPDSKLRYLEYLIDTIFDYDNEAKIVYQSQITEQDYNGTFTDIILNIDSSESFNKQYIVSPADNISDDVIYIDNEDEKQHLYGWTKQTIDNKYDWVGPKTYKTVKPIFDDNETGDNVKRKYNCLPKYKYTVYDKPENETSITFNVVIPLYDVVNFDPSTNKVILSDEKQITDLIELDKGPSTDEHVTNVPYGIWFSNEPITLKRANFNNYAPSWSLLIATQFKPFPNSQYLVADNNSESKMAGFATFAQILARQNEILDILFEYKKSLDETRRKSESQISEYISTIKNLSERVDELTNELNIHVRNNSIHNEKTITQWTSGK